MRRRRGAIRRARFVRPYLAFGLLVGGLASAASASTPPDAEAEAILLRDPLAIADLLQIADFTSPEIAAARLEAAAAYSRARQAGALPNPTLGVEAAQLPADAPRLEDGERTIGISLPVDVVGRGGRVAAARAAAEARAQDARVVRRAVHRRVREAAETVVRLRDALAARRRLRERAARVEEIARLRWEARAEPRTHALKAAIELASVDARTARLEADLRGAVADLEAILGGIDIPEDRLAAREEPAAERSLEALRDAVSTLHPRLLAARARSEAARAAAASANVSWVPEPELRVAYGRDPADAEFVEAGASFELPLFDRGRAEAQAARADVAAAERGERRAEAELDAEAVAAFARWAASRERLRLQRDVVAPAAETSSDLATEGYEAGRLGFLDLLDALRTLAEAQDAGVELSAEHAAATAALEELAPTSMEEGEGR
jgi:cobalt-zinc-cadmium efflux system outer membrane protein